MEGKANEMFLDWITSKYFFKDKRYSNLNIYQKGDIGEFLRFPITKHAYILEWLDSVEIIIEIGIHQRIRDLNMWRGKINNFLYDDLEFKVSRQEATEVAIKKAVEIYNSKYGNPQVDPETTK
ncbi:hypothetical protein HZQ12_17630 [Elizabethkingia anophelis]|uniref:hypothetical protein n=1 Tax=Elizabethkingia anophelis TaxID=1117645 RepID=UPI0021A3B634|nr:hypothetical protein [Elizabethkingia anophelis]